MGFNPTMFDHEKAFQIALSKTNKVSQDIESYDFMYGTETVSYTHLTLPTT